MKRGRPARRRTLRLAQAVLLQRRRSLRYELPPATEPRRALVTGGNKGIGAAVTAKLRDAGWEVVVAAREGDVHLDLADLDQVAAAAGRIAAGGPFDLVVLNAGVAPAGIERSAQGHELAYAVNVLGHHVLLQRLPLADHARVVAVTGDILVLARNCTPDFTSDHRRAGGMAYARSKLGVLWLAGELARRHPELHVVAVHPGVVRSGLGGGARPWHRLIQITPERSSEAVLAAAFDADVPSGGYVHNTLGLLPSTEAEPDARFVAALDDLAAPWLDRG